MAKFQKGQSGNPAGKKPGTLSKSKVAFNALLKEIAESKEYQDGLKARAIAGDSTLDKEILARVLGAVPKVMQIETPAPLVIDVVEGPPDDSR